VSADPAVDFAAFDVFPLFNCLLAVLPTFFDVCSFFPISYPSSFIKTSLSQTDGKQSGEALKHIASTLWLPLHYPYLSPTAVEVAATAAEE